jgi:hypothetical protein
MGRIEYLRNSQRTIDLRKNQREEAAGVLLGFILSGSRFARCSARRRMHLRYKSDRHYPEFPPEIPPIPDIQVSFAAL